MYVLDSACCAPESTHRKKFTKHQYHFNLAISYRRFSHARTCIKESKHQKPQIISAGFVNTANGNSECEQGEKSSSEEPSDADGTS